MDIQVKVTDPRILKFGLPSIQTLGSAGLDLRVLMPEGTHGNYVTLKAGESIMLDTGLSLWIQDPNYAGFMFARSGLGSKGLVLGNGTGIIDSDYQGPLKICLFNRSNKDMTINDGDRVAQLVIMPVKSGYSLNIVEEFDAGTGRGEGGFGSTGLQ
jgi:dUTP pyrophosphatase